MNSSVFKLIIGLGNPDEKYENTYHNVGRLFIDYLEKNSTLYPKPYTLKTDVYMNESGAFVKKALKKAGAKPEEILIIHDDSDLQLGKYKFSFGHGAAGHHGIENIMTTLKTKNFWRLRIGIRPPKEKIRQKAEKFVLKKISAVDKKILEDIFQKTSLEINQLVA
jgi:PTH1 family peptidyl-tRNA hydrolase